MCRCSIFARTRSDRSYWYGGKQARNIALPPNPPDGRQLTAGARAIMARFHSMAADHAALSAALDRLGLGEGAA